MLMMRLFWLQMLRAWAADAHDARPPGAADAHDVRPPLGASWETEAPMPSLLVH